MKKREKTGKESRPWRPLVPVLLLLAADLVIYLYFIAINVKNLKFWPLTQESTMNILLIASYFFTTIAMLLTLTSYFAVKASVKANQSTPLEKIATEDIPIDDSIDLSKSENIPNPPTEVLPKVIDTEKQVIPQIIEKKSEEKNIPVIEASTPVNEEIEKPVKIIEYSGGVESKWKKIGVKLTDDDSLGKQQELTPPIEPAIQEVKDPSTIVPIPQIVEAQAEKQQTEVLIDPIKESKETLNDAAINAKVRTRLKEEAVNKSEEPLTEIKPIDIEQELVKEAPQELKPAEEPLIEAEPIEEPPIEIETVEDDLESDVLRDLKELKLMVEEMKIKVERRKIKNT
jgi:hypothetical protein